MKRFKNCIFISVSGVRSGRITYTAFPQNFTLHQAQQHPEVLLWHYWGECNYSFLHHFSGAASISEYLPDVHCDVLQVHSCVSGFRMQGWLQINYFQVRVIWLEICPSNEVRNSVCSLHCVETLQDTLHGLFPLTVPVPSLYSPFPPPLILPGEQENNDGSSGSLPKGGYHLTKTHFPGECLYLLALLCCSSFYELSIFHILSSNYQITHLLLWYVTAFSASASEAIAFSSVIFCWSFWFSPSSLSSSVYWTLHILFQGLIWLCYSCSWCLSNPE